MSVEQAIETGKIIGERPYILAADESVSTANKRLESIGIMGTIEGRHAYRELFLTTPGLDSFLTGIILFEETVDQIERETGQPFPAYLAERGIMPGIKVDKGLKPLGNLDEQVSQGLDDLDKRLKDYAAKGLRFAKWRSVISIKGGEIPSDACIDANALVLAQYAAFCQRAGMLAIVEPEVLLDGDHSLHRSASVLRDTLDATFWALGELEVELGGVVLKSSMALPGKDAVEQAGVEEIAKATVDALQQKVPEEVPAVVFLSGGQTSIQATERLNAIAQQGEQPWGVGFSYARALQGDPLKIWEGNPDNVGAAQAAFVHRLQCNIAAARGEYTPEIEEGV